MAFFFRIAIVAVALATQALLPRILLALASILQSELLRKTADEVRKVGREGIESMEQSRQWFEGQAGASARPAADSVRRVTDSPPVHASVRVDSGGERARVHLAGTVDEGDEDLDESASVAGRTSKG
jgi:hypothetical protein